MVFLATTPSGLFEAMLLAEGAPIWCGANVLDEAAFAELGAGNVTRFNHVVDGREPEVLAQALATIREHHPHERVWVEG